MSVVPSSHKISRLRSSIRMVVAGVAFLIAGASGTDRRHLAAAAAYIAGTPSVAAVPA